jgi:hypothetical protein
VESHFYACQLFCTKLWNEKDGPAEPPNMSRLTDSAGSRCWRLRCPTQSMTRFGVLSLFFLFVSELPRLPLGLRLTTHGSMALLALPSKYVFPFKNKGQPFKSVRAVGFLSCLLTKSSRWMPAHSLKYQKKKKITWIFIF